MNGHIWTTSGHITRIFFPLVHDAFESKHKNRIDKSVILSLLWNENWHCKYFIEQIRLYIWNYFLYWTNWSEKMTLLFDSWMNDTKHYGIEQPLYKWRNAADICMYPALRLFVYLLTIFHISKRIGLNISTSE